MPFAAIIYDIKPGHEDQVGQVFRDFRRPASAAVPDRDGLPVARILATAVFIRNDLCVRVIEYEGNLDAVARFMGSQPGVQEIERKLKPFLRTPRDTGTVDGFVRTFQQNLLRCVIELSVPR